jgi:hypothetical protein
MWTLLVIFGLTVLLQNMQTIPMDERYAYIFAGIVLTVTGVVLAPVYWAILALLAAITILYFAERWYARQWGYARLWWYRFFLKSADV